MTSESTEKAESEGKCKETLACAQRHFRFAVPIGMAVVFSSLLLHASLRHCGCLPEFALQDDELVTRVTFALRCLIVPLVLFAAAIVRVGETRDGSVAIDPQSPAGESLVAVKKALLQNTFEQLFLFSISTLTLSTYLCQKYLWLIPHLCGLFIVGRLCYWYGYHRAHYKRAFGFALTMWSNVAVLMLIFIQACLPKFRDFSNHEAWCERSPYLLLGIFAILLRTILKKLEP